MKIFKLIRKLTTCRNSFNLLADFYSVAQQGNSRDTIPFKIKDFINRFKTLELLIIIDFRQFIRIWIPHKTND